MKLIVGLGNPGREYENTRHNMGFMVLDRFAEMVKADISKEKFKGLYAIVKNPDLPEDLILLKPQTFMNLSGESVRPLADYFKIDVNDIIVVYDDMAIAPGEIRLRESGSSGSHKGIQNIIDNFKTNAIKRIRVGIGEPKYNTIDFVLGKPEGEEKEKIDAALERAAKALRDIVMHSFAYAMSRNNGKVGK